MLSERLLEAQREVEAQTGGVDTNAGALSLVAEAATFVTLAADMDDGEAVTIAIARHRGFSGATDDRKARRSLAEAQVQVFSSLELLRMWCDSRSLSTREVTRLLTYVRDRGRFVPPRGDPLQGWWDADVSSHS